jgi:hypothetical protein
MTSTMTGQCAQRGDHGSTVTGRPSKKDIKVDSAVALLAGGKDKADGAPAQVNGIPSEDPGSQVNGAGASMVPNNKVETAPAINPATYEPIAIIGCAMRLPGGVSDSKALWELLLNKREGRVLVPESRYNIEAYHPADQQPKFGQVRPRHGWVAQLAERVFEALD